MLIVINSNSVMLGVEQWGRREAANTQPNWSMTQFSAAAGVCLECKLRPSVGWTTATICIGVARLQHDVDRTERNAVAVPVAIVLHDGDDVITVRVHKLRPCLPQRMYNVVYEANLQRHKKWSLALSRWRIIDGRHQNTTTSAGKLIRY